MKKSPKEYRFKNNPEEQKFFELASSQFEFSDIHETVGYILHGVNNTTQGPMKYATDEEVHSFLMTLQWLGSPIGQGFLRDAGYVNAKVEEKDTPVQINCLKWLRLR